MDCSPAGSSVHGILQARILEWVAIAYSRDYFWPRDWTWGSPIHVSCISGGFFTVEKTGKPYSSNKYNLFCTPITHVNMVTWAYKMDVVATWLAFGLAPKKWGQTHTHTHKDMDSQQLYLCQPGGGRGQLGKRQPLWLYASWLSLVQSAKEPGTAAVMLCADWGAREGFCRPL